MPAITDAAFRLPLDVRPLRYDAVLSVDVEGRRFHGELTLSLQLARAGRRAGAARRRAHADPRGGRGGRRRAARPTVIAGGGQRDGAAGLRPAAAGRSGHPAPGLERAASATGCAASTWPARGWPPPSSRRPTPAASSPASTSRASRRPGGSPSRRRPARWCSPTARPWPSSAVGERRRHRFAETPPLPTYLVALVVGPLAAGPADQVRGVADADLGQPGEGARCSASGRRWRGTSLPRLEDYFGLPYAFGKLDQVGLPEFEAGAMENAGLITYREVALLLDPATASLAQRKRVAEVVTHELAHQWFGNLVTMTWWDDLWLNEAFATWIASLIVDDWRPEWRVWLDFDQGKASALALDALRSTHPVHAPVRTVAEATEAFDVITYEKGGAVLRMLEGYLGREHLPRRHSPLHAAPPAGQRAWPPISGARWARPRASRCWSWPRPGSTRPASRWCRRRWTGTRCGLAQRRFFSRPGDAEPEARWPVPVVLRYAVGRAGARAAAGAARRGRDGGAGGAARLAGGQRRRHRLLPGGARWGARRAAGWATSTSWRRPSGWRCWPTSGRWSAAASGRWRAWMALALAFAGETDHAVLDELVARLAAIEHRLVAAGDRPRLAALVRARYGEAFRAAGWDAAAGEGDVERLRRAALLKAVGVVGRDEAAIAEATARLERFAAGDRAALEPNLVDAAVTWRRAAATPPASSGSRPASSARWTRPGGAAGCWGWRRSRRRRWWSVAQRLLFGDGRAAAGLGGLRDRAAGQSGGAPADLGPAAGRVAGGDRAAGQRPHALAAGDRGGGAADHAASSWRRRGPSSPPSPSSRSRRRWRRRWSGWPRRSELAERAGPELGAWLKRNPVRE